MRVDGYTEDTLIKMRVVAPQLPAALDAVSHILHHGKRWKTEFRILGDKNASKRFTGADPIARGEYNALDAWFTDLDDDLLSQKLLQVPRGEELYREFLALNDIGIQMRRDGVPVIKENMKHHRVTLGSRLRYARQELVEIAASNGVSNFNPNAPEQIKSLFFGKFGIIATKWSEKTQAPSLDKAALVKVLASDDKVIKRAAFLLLKYKKWQKLLKSYIKNLPVSRQGRVHPCWNVTGAKTGRWSCQDPALQTIPKPVYEKNSKGQDVLVAPGLRDLFGPSPGNVIVEVDFRQFEAYTIALMSGDRKLKELLDTGDVHSATAKIIMGYTDDEWNALPPFARKKQREMSKRARYGLHYLGTAENVWRALVGDYPELTLMEILNLFRGFKKLHPDIVGWQNEQIRLAKKSNCITCPITGRRYEFWGEIEVTACANIPNQMVVAKRTNDTIRDVVKVLRPGERILAQVHDSIVAEGPDPISLATRIKTAAEKPVRLNGMEVSFGVDCKWGPNWGNLEELKL